MKKCKLELINFRNNISLCCWCESIETGETLDFVDEKHAYDGEEERETPETENSNYPSSFYYSEIKNAGIDDE